MENQLYIPNQVLSSVSKENAEAIRENVTMINKLVTEFSLESETNVRKAEHILYMLLILEKIIYPNNAAVAELAKIHIIRKEIMDRLKENPDVTRRYRSNLLYPLTSPEIIDKDITNILYATLCSSPDPLVFKGVKDMIIPENCVIYKMYTNSDFYYYSPNKGFVGQPVPEKAVTEDLIKQTQYIKKIESKKNDYEEDITVEIIGSPFEEKKGGKSVSVFFILNDEKFAEIKTHPTKDNELYTSRYNIFSILPKDFEFVDLKAKVTTQTGVLSDLFAKQKLEDLFISILIKRSKTPKHVAILNTLTEIFLQKLNRLDELLVEEPDRIWNKAFFYEKQHVYMLYFERILGIIDNAGGVTNESVIKVLVNIVSSDDTSNFASVMSELKK